MRIPWCVLNLCSWYQPLWWEDDEALLYRNKIFKALVSSSPLQTYQVLAEAGERIQKLLLMKRDLKRARKNRQAKYYKRSSREGDGGGTAGSPKEPGMGTSFVSLFWPSLEWQEQTVQLVRESLTHKPKNASLYWCCWEKQDYSRSTACKATSGMCLSWCHTSGTAQTHLKRFLEPEALWGPVQLMAKAIPASQAHHKQGLDLALYTLGLQAPMKTFHMCPKDFL